MTLEFASIIRPEHILQFAGFTADRNSLHLNPEFARKFRHREPLVHGMLGFSQLALVQGCFPGQRISFRKLAGQFVRPVFVNDELRCAINCNPAAAGGYEFTARWWRVGNQEEVMVAHGEFATSKGAEDVPAAAPGEVTFVPAGLAENELLIDQLPEREECFEFRLTRSGAAAYRAMLAGVLVNPASVPAGGGVCPNLLATILFSSLVGMKLPGRFATFLNFEVGFERELQWDAAHTLSGRVEKVAATSAKITVRAQISRDGVACAEGKCSTLVNPPPRKMPSCAELNATHLDLGLKGKVVLVTGASRGIGEVTAKLFALLGAKVAVHYFRGKTDAAEIANEIKLAGGEAMAVACDVRDESQVQAMVQRVVERFGDIDVLVNNAVKDVEPKRLEDLAWADFSEELEVSLKGLHHCCRAVIPGFLRRQGGKIINLSTSITDSPVSGQAKYIASKSAVVGYTRSLAVELAGQNIQANVVAPSLTDTDLMLSHFSPAMTTKLAGERPAGRNVRPVEVAQSIVFLASDWADAINGQRLFLNLGESPFL